MSNPAEAYEAYAVPILFAPWAARLVEFAQPRPGERVLDVGCGTGIVARLIASRIGTNGSVTAIDLSADMVAVGRAAAEQEHLPITWHEGVAESLPFADASFDLVTSQEAVQFFADRKAALAQIHRVLKPRGRVALSLWQGLDSHPFYRTLHEVIQERLGMSGVEQIFSIGKAGQVDQLLTGAGFRNVDILSVSMTTRFPDPQAFLAGEIDIDTACIPSMQHLDERERARVTGAIKESMAGPLRAVTEGDHVVIDFHAHFARAHS